MQETRIYVSAAFFGQYQPQHNSNLKQTIRRFDENNICHLTKGTNPVIQITLGKAMRDDSKFSCKTHLKTTNVIKIHFQHFKKLIIQQSIQFAIQYFSPLIPPMHNQFSFKRLQNRSFRPEREGPYIAEQIPILWYEVKWKHKRVQRWIEAARHATELRDFPFRRPLSQVHVITLYGNGLAQLAYFISPCVLHADFLFVPSTLNFDKFHSN